MATTGSFTHQDQYKADQSQAAPTTSSESSSVPNADLSKDEVGWYFVEQYYTTLSKSPEKLHLFYGKQSQFVYGLEAEVANVSVGRQAIQERIKQLDFQDCKVRISNVDSQASSDNIVIQVIGETSNKAGEPKKFVQTFVLAKQPSGYFVLNDILRYIDEESDDESAEPATEDAAEEPEVAAEPTAPAEPEAAKSAEKTEEEPAQLDTTVVDQKLEEVSATKEESTAVNGSVAESAEESKASDTKSEATTADPEVAVKQLEEEDAKEPEKPQDPVPSPVSKPAAPPAPAAAPVTPAPAEPTGPPKPMTWASRAAAAAGPKPVVPLAKTPTPPAQARAPAPATAAPTSQPATEKAPAPATGAAAEAPAKEAQGWQTAGVDSKRQGRPQSISGPPTEKEGTLGYVKYVTDKVQEADLRNALAAHGELTYFDINRQKNCAFVEYKTPEGYQAAVAANPHTINGENIVVEPRRPKAGAYGGGSFGPGGRGNASGRPRGGFDGNRSGSQGSRGNFSGQGRGRGGASRGRGGAQPSNA